MLVYRVSEAKKLLSISEAKKLLTKTLPIREYYLQKTLPALYKIVESNPNYKKDLGHLIYEFVNQIV